MWNTVKLGDVLRTGAGGTPLKSKKEFYDGGDIKWLLSGAVCEKYINESKTHITSAGLKNSSAKIFPINTVLVAMYGATAGQVGILRTEAATNQAVCGIYPSNDFLPEFLYYYLSNYKETLLLEVSGVAQPNLSQVKIKNIPLPKISLAEQQRIVAKLDAVFAEIDRAIEASEKSLANAKHLFEQQRNYRYELAKDSHPCHKLSDVAELSRGHNPPKSEFIHEPKEGYVRFYQIRDAKTDKHATYVPDSEKLKRVKPHDFLMNAYRHIGEVFKGADGAFNVALCKLSIKDVNVVNSEYLYYMIPSTLIKGELLKTSARSLIPSMSVKELAEFYVPIPPLQEQQKFVAELLSIKQYSSQITDIYAKKLSHLSALKSAILSQELQPQRSEAA